MGEQHFEEGQAVANGQLILERERAGRLVNLGVRFFLSAALTAGQTAGGSAPFALGLSLIHI